MSTLNFRKDISKPGLYPKRKEDDQRPEGKCYADVLGMFSLEKRRLEIHMVAVFKYLRLCHEEDGQTFSQAFSLWLELFSSGRGFLRKWQSFL